MPLQPEPQALLKRMLSMPFTHEGKTLPREYIGRITNPRDHTEPVVRVDGVESIRDVTITSYDGGTFTARLYTPEGAGPFPIHVYFHGGGWIVGSAYDDRTDMLSQRRCAQAQSTVLNVDYRLAPEFPFPTGVEDCYKSVLWVQEHAAEIGGDAERISVGGASAGGNLAAAVSVMAQDRQGPKLILQLLEIAELDCTKSTYMWRYGSPNYDVTRKDDLLGVDMYLANPRDRVHPYASPMMAPDLSNVAPVYALSAEFDPRRDSVEMYAARIQDAGGEAVTHTMLGHIHGSNMLIDNWEPARQWQVEANAALRHANRSSGGRVFDDFDPEHDSTR
ncbi:MAG TPA: alpha/beta hydrolase [Galbitalea sp.]|nr:alpha/beta hydrolase [Galbitalea sp.]